MKIKPGGKIALFLILAVIIFFVVRRFIPPTQADNTTLGTTTNDKPVSPGREDANSESVKPVNTEGRTFNYTPEKPVDGKLRGVVEVGASGFNSFVINMDKQRRWEIISKDFGESLAYEGLATTDDIRSGLKKYLAAMFAKGVNKNDMHFVISSGAQKEPKTAIIVNELKKIGYVVNTVTADQEAKYGLKATVPPSFQDNSFMVDIGSGNTKISWDEAGSLKAMEVTGAKYYERGLADNAVYNEIKAKAANIPTSKRNVCFIIGGVPFTLAKQHRSGEERFTVLNESGKYTAGTDKKTASGLNIYKAIADATNCDTFVFDWDANFTIGFLLSLPL